MPIPESQLETWSHQGSVAQSSSTYNSIKNVLEASTTPYASKNFKVFLQGSYGNNTNIHAESDVDIVIQLDSCFQSDLSNLTEDEKAAYKSAFRDATYTHADFKKDVLSVLSGKYGSDVKAGDKAIAIDAAQAGAAAFKAIVGIPYVGPVLAVAAAAAAVMEVKKFASFDVGAWNIPHDMPAMVHQGEAILPRPFADDFRSAMSGRGSMGGGDTYHLHVHAVDGDSVRRLFMENGEHIAAAMGDQIRTGWRP